MKGLLLKDLIVLKSYGRTLIVLVLFYAFFGIFTNDSCFVSSIIPFLALFMSVSAFSYDDSSHWNEYALTLPVSRRQMVMARYLLALLMLLAGTLLALVMSVLVTPLTGGSAMPFQETLLITASVSCAGLAVVSVIFPLLYKFGAEKGRLLILAVTMVPFMLFFLISKLGISLPTPQNPELLIAVGLPVVGILSLVVSFFISVGILQRKEF